MDRLSGRLARIVYLIRALARKVSLPTLLTAYHGYFSSVMSYACLNWGHSAHANKIFKLQRRCVRVMAGLGYRDCCRQCFRDLNILTLPCMYILQCLSYIRANLPQFPGHADVHDYNTRHRHNILPDYHRLSRTRRGSDYYCVKFYNALPVPIRALDTRVFLIRVKAYLINSAYYSFDEYLNGIADIMP